jgi:hypothetical protein
VILRCSISVAESPLWPPEPLSRGQQKWLLSISHRGFGLPDSHGQTQVWLAVRGDEVVHHWRGRVHGRQSGSRPRAGTAVKAIARGLTTIGGCRGDFERFGPVSRVLLSSIDCSSAHLVERTLLEYA